MPQGFHAAPRHTFTTFTDKPKQEAVEQWEKSHPDCTIEQTIGQNGQIEIVYVKNAELEAATLANAKAGTRIEPDQDFQPKIRHRGIQL